MNLKVVDIYQDDYFISKKTKDFCFFSTYGKLIYFSKYFVNKYELEKQQKYVSYWEDDKTKDKYIVLHDKPNKNSLEIKSYNQQKKYKSFFVVASTLFVPMADCYKRKRFRLIETPELNKEYGGIVFKVVKLEQK